MFEFETIRIAIALIGTTVATYFDIFNNRNVPNILTYSLVALGILFNLAGGTASLSIIGIAAVIFIFGYLLYQNGQIGGADVLLFVALALLIPEQPKSSAATQGVLELPFIISLFITSGILFAVFMLITYLPKVAYAIRDNRVSIKNTNLLFACLLLALFLIAMYQLNQLVQLSFIYITLMTLVVLSAMFFLLFKDFVIESYFVQSVSINQIEEEDVLALELMDKDKVKEHNLKKLITKSELKKLQETGIEKFPVYKNMPVFMPYILVALIILVLFGDPFTYAIFLSLR